VGPVEVSWACRVRVAVDASPRTVGSRSSSPPAAAFLAGPLAAGALAAGEAGFWAGAAACTGVLLGKANRDGRRGTVPR